MKTKFLDTAKKESKKSNLQTKVGAVLVLGKTIIKGHNKDKTHPEFANPEKHVRKSLHAELDCIIKARNRKFPNVIMTGGTIFIFREVKGIPAMARPCEHCMEFLKKSGITKVVYTIPNFPYSEEEEI